MSRYLLMAATLLSGLLAGIDIDRTLVAMPAWDRVGALPWADFSRHADLGRGLLLYPLEALGGFLLTLAAAISLRLERPTSRQLLRMLYTASGLCAAGLALTLGAAPIMLGVRSEANPAALRVAFEGFWYWGNLRGLCQTGAFTAQVYALARLGPTTSPRLESATRITR